ncbi:MAG: hypothetical protein V3571_08975 [Pseudodesulfovibrio sp.]
MADIVRLPGCGCRHFEGGRCLYEEHLNPGYQAGYRCRVLVRWESAFDSFLARAENFRVDHSSASALWERQFQRTARKTFQCGDYEFQAEAEAPACRHVRGGLCRLSLPECKGRCRHFRLAMSEENE